MIRMFFGAPGCGKTTAAVRFIRKEQKAQAKFEKWQKKRFKSPLKRFRMFLKNPTFYDHYYTNFDTKLSTSVKLNDLGQWTLPPYTHLTVDESGIEYNNRKFKSLDQNTIQWLKLHRHYRVDIDFYSQSWEDTDVTIRRLADPQSQIAREIILPKAKSIDHIDGGQKLRIVFDGNSSFEPVVSNMVLDCRTPVNILFADTRDIDGKAFGQMVLQLPDDEGALARITKFLDSRGITYSREGE